MNTDNSDMGSLDKLLTAPPPPPSTDNCMNQQNYKDANKCCIGKINSDSYCNTKGVNSPGTCHDSRSKPGPDVNCSFTTRSCSPIDCALCTDSESCTNAKCKYDQSKNTCSPPSPPPPSPGPKPGPPPSPGPKPGPPKPPSPNPPTPPPTPGPPSKSSNHALYIALGIIGGLILIGVILYFFLPK